MDFKLVAKTEAPKKAPRETTFDEELTNAVNEIWEVIREHGDGYVVELPSFGQGEDGAKAANKWMARAQAYGKTVGVFLSRARAYVPSEENGLVLTGESLAEREQRIADAKTKAEELAARKAAGEEVKRGGKRAGAGRKKEPVAA
jgi:hypothetical protein